MKGEINDDRRKNTKVVEEGENQLSREKRKDYGEK